MFKYADVIMRKNIFIIFLIMLLVVTLVVVFEQNKVVVAVLPVESVKVEEESVVLTESSEVIIIPAATEQYSAQVDRVKVIFEQWDFTRYRLQTNELVREGEMNSERGFGDDLDATVYVLNWQKPEGEQIRYVRLTAEPGYLYVLDGYQNIIKSGRLVLEPIN